MDRGRGSRRERLLLKHNAQRHAASSQASQDRIALDRKTFDCEAFYGETVNREALGCKAFDKFACEIRWSGCDARIDGAQAGSKALGCEALHGEARNREACDREACDRCSQATQHRLADYAFAHDAWTSPNHPRRYYRQWWWGRRGRELTA